MSSKGYYVSRVPGVWNLGDPIASTLISTVATFLIMSKSSQEELQWPLASLDFTLSYVVVVVRRPWTYEHSIESVLWRQFFHLSFQVPHFMVSFLFVFVLHLPPFCVFCSSSSCLKWLVYADYDPYAVAGVCNDHGKTYALYAITVHRRNLNTEEMWKTYRRYSDFHDFHMRITEQVMRFVMPVAFILFVGSALDLHFSKNVHIV